MQNSAAARFRQESTPSPSKAALSPIKTTTVPPRRAADRMRDKIRRLPFFSEEPSALLVCIMIHPFPSKCKLNCGQAPYFGEKISGRRGCSMHLRRPSGGPACQKKSPCPARLIRAGQKSSGARRETLRAPRSRSATAVPAVVVAVVVTATAPPAPATAEQDDEQENDPQTAVAAPTVIAAPHMSTS